MPLSPEQEERLPQLQKIQVAFQGGGARFIEMLPLAHALADAHANDINITRVAGSSAGSICAALVACQADFEVVRDFILANGSDRIREMRRWSSRKSNSNASRLVRYARAPITVARTGVALGRAAFGRRLLNTSVLVTFLDELFRKSAGTSVFEIGTIDQICQIKLVVSGSHLHKSEGVVFDNGSLLATLIDSSAIPFAFRSFRDVELSPIVDGGLCENLPVDLLVRLEDSDGPVFCVSILEDAGKYIPKGIGDYCNQLISASMNHNVVRAKRTVGASNVFEAKASVGTFDFEEAIVQLANDKWYDDVYEATRAKINAIAELYSSVVAPSAADHEPANLSGRLSAPKIMNSLARVFEKSRAATDWDYLKSAFVVRAENLRARKKKVRGTKKEEKEEPIPADHVVRIATIRAKSSNLVGFTSSAALNAEGSIVPTKWTCFNETKKRILKVQPIPMRKRSGEAADRVKVLIFFEDPEHEIEAGDIVSIKSYYLDAKAMAGLRTDGRDYASITNPHDMPVEETHVVLIYPSRFGNVRADGNGQGTLIKDEVIRAFYLSDTTEGYKAVGCSAANVLPGGHFRVDFSKIKTI
jgi:predicted acylesterase/phospholipase RssA